MRARGWPLALGALAAVVLGLFGPVVLTGRYYPWDATEQYWGDLVYLCGALHDGEWPRWNPYDRGGYPVIADPQAALYHPLTWLLCAAGADPPLALAELRVALHFLLAGAGMAALLRRLALPWPAVMVGALAFMLAPFQRRMWGVNPSYGLAYLPLVLLGIEAVARRPGPRAAAGLALAVALAGAAGSPPALYYTLWAAAAWACAALVSAERRGAAAAWLAAGGALAAAMLAVVLVPAAQLTVLSVQAGRDYASISAGGIPAAALGGLAWPGHAYVYVGAPALLLALAGLRAPALPRPLRIALGVLALLALLLMLGDRTPVFRAAYAVVPGVDLFRSPQRYSALLGCAVAVLAAGGAAALLPRLPARLRLLPALATLGALLADLPEDWRGVAGPPPGGAAALAHLRPRIDPERRVWDEFALSLRAGSRHRLRDLRGYQDPLMLRRYEQVIGKLHEHPRMLEQWSVGTLLRGPHFIHGDSHHYLPAGREPELAEPAGDGVWRTRAPLPGAYWVPRAATFAPGDPALLERLRAIAPRAVCLLEVAGPRPDAAPGPAAAEAAAAQAVPARARVGRNTVHVEVDAPRAGWLVVAEVDYPGWRATVDGRAAPVERANWLMRAVHVPAGRHQVVLRFEPEGYAALCALAASACALALALVTRRSRAR